jgi:hypothetical protein
LKSMKLKGKGTLFISSLPSPWERYSITHLIMVCISVKFVNYKQFRQMAHCKLAFPYIGYQLTCGSYWRRISDGDTFGLGTDTLLLSFPVLQCFLGTFLKNSVLRVIWYCFKIVAWLFPLVSGTENVLK